MHKLSKAALAILTMAAAAALPGSLSAQHPAGIRGEVLEQFNEAANKLVQLAEAIPQAKYTWRPMDGVRSVSEVLLHVAGSDEYQLAAVGVKAPVGGRTTWSTPPPTRRKSSPC